MILWNGAFCRAFACYSDEETKGICDESPILFNKDVHRSTIDPVATYERVAKNSPDMTPKLGRDYPCIPKTTKVDRCLLF